MTTSVDTTLLRELWKGSYFIDNEHYNKISVEFMDKLQADWVSAEEEYKKGFNSNLQRIECFQKYFRWTEIPTKILNRFQKSKAVSSALREAGNTAYKAGDVSNALRGYNLALSFAPNETEELSLVYGNRAAVFLQLEMPNEALRDVEEALKFSGHCEKVQERLQERKVKCQRLLQKGQKEGGKKEEDEDVFKNLFASEDQEEGREFCEKKLLQVNNNQSSQSAGGGSNNGGVLKGAADFVKVVYSPECGRRLVVTQDVPAGTPCIAEEPFVTALDRLLTWDTEHCGFCCKPFFGGIPCPSCTFIHFCDAGCLEKSLECGHELEHDGCLTYLHSTEAFHSNEILLLLRILFKVGPNSLFKMFQEELYLLLDTKSTRKSATLDLDLDDIELPFVGFDKVTRTYDSSSYTSVYHLVSHKVPYNCIRDTNNSHDLPPPVEFQCIFLSKLLQETTSFFKEIPPESLNSFKTFVALIILQHMENLQYNILSLCEWYTPSLGPLSLSLWAQQAKSSRKNPITKCYATGVFPLVALCNHSCDPNAIFVKNCHLPGASVITSRRLKAGDELLISYKAPFTRMRWEDRQSYLLENYKFTCECYACTRKYSVESTTPYPVDISKCPTCWEIPREQFYRMCSKCKMRVERSSQVLERLGEAQEMIRKERFTKAYEILREESDFLSLHYTPNYEVFQVTQDLLRRTVVHLIHL